jgi:feruloyl esterase
VSGFNQHQAFEIKEAGDMRSSGKCNGGHAWKRTLLLWISIATVPAAYSAAATAGEDNAQQIARCAALQQAQIKDTRIELAQALPAGSSLTKVDGTSVTTRTPVCRIVATVSTAPEKHLGIEVWLPLADWNARLLGTGKSGFGGYIDYDELTAAVARGFAAVNSDTGYKGKGSGEPGKLLEWAANPETLRDWGHLSVHLMTVAAKELIQAYYGRSAQYSYLDTCGGVEAMTEVEYFPDDYDGVEARSPGMYYSHLMESFLWGAMLPAHQPDALLTHDALALLNHAVLQSCGGVHALEDGFLEHPMQCHFDPAQLQCKTGDTPANCLSAVQVQQAQRLYSPTRNALTGAALYPGFARGSELAWGAIQYHLAAYYAQPLLASAVFGNAAWEWTTYDFGADSALVDRKLALLLNATNPDISRFAARGGKVIMTQGWADEVNAPTKPIEYFDAVAKHEGGIASAQRSFRLLMVPGMGHCGIGPGPTTIGGALPPTKYTPDRDVVSALQAWVEHGKAPTRFISTKYVGDKPNNGVKFERPVCVYPMESRYNGSGDRRLASSFSCVKATPAARIP